MEKLEVSLVIPNYNNGCYLPEAISSALQQTYEFKEIIIVDDCSTDNSREIINKLCDENKSVKSIFLRSNSGVSNARNIGLKHVRTEYVTFMDADDFYFSKDKIRNEVYKLIERRLCNEEPLIYSITVFGDHAGRKKLCMTNIWRPKWQFMEGNVFYRLLAPITLERAPRDYIIKTKTLIDIGGYCNQISLFEDYDMLLRIARTDTPFYCTYSEGTLYRDSLSGLSKKKEDELKKSLAGITNKYYCTLAYDKRIKIRFLMCIAFVMRKSIGFIYFWGRLYMKLYQIYKEK